MANAQDNDNKWIINPSTVSIDVVKKGTTSVNVDGYHFNTAGKFVDRDIEIGKTPIEVNVESGVMNAAVSASVEGSASNEAKGFTASTEATPYYVELSTEAASATAQTTVKTAGFVAADDVVTADPVAIGVSGNGDKLYIPEAGIDASVDSLVVPTVSTSAEAKGMAVSTAETEFYVEVSNTATAGSVKATASGTGVGMISAATSDTSAESEINATVDADKKVYIKPASYNNAATEGEEYTDISDSAPALISGDYLYIDAGYSPAAKISLAKLVPDQASMVEGKAELLYKTETAYDNDGKLIAGTMDDAEISAEASDVAADITSITPAYNAETGKYDVTGDGAISGKINASTTKTGYAVVGTTKAEGIDISGTAELAATLNTVSLKATKDGDISITPTVANKAVAITDKTQVTAAPSTETAGIDKYYVAVAVSGNGDATVAPGVASAGYTDGENFEAASETVNAEIATNVTYVPIATAGVASDEATATITAGTGITISESAPSGDYYTLTANAEGNSKITSAGYIEAGSLDAASATKDYYIAKSAHTNIATATISTAPTYSYTTAAPTVSSASYDITAISTTAPASAPYITIAPSGSATAGVAAANAKATNTAGYCAGDTVDATESTAVITAEKTGESVSRYIEVYTGLYSLV